MKKMILMRGWSGCGKSYLARQIADEYNNECALTALIHSTDNFFFNKLGKYEFDGKKLGSAHLWNQSEVRKSMEDGFKVVIVDNTNTMSWEASVYVSLAKEYSYEIEVCEPQAEWKFNIDECAKRNTHGVPRESIQKMMDRWESTEEFKRKLGIV